MEEKKYYTYTELKQLGFSKKIIEKNLPEPILKDNPFYKCANPMKLYLKQDVDEFIKTDFFQEHLIKREKRVKSALKVAEKHRKETEVFIEQKIQEICITRISINELRHRTIQHKEEWYDDFIDLEYLRNETLNRWMINYVRHELTEYDETLYGLCKKTGKYDAYIKYREAVMAKIEEVYPELFDKNESEK